MNPPLFRLKICGVRSIQDLEAVAAAGADAIGLNFYPPSIRYIDVEPAKSLSQRAAELKLMRVGVFVNLPMDELLAIAAGVSLEIIQLHGDESLREAAKIAEASGLTVLRAIRLPRGSISVETIQRLTRPWLDAGFPILLDADAGSQFGGSGASLDWRTIGHWNDWLTGSLENHVSLRHGDEFGIAKSSMTGVVSSAGEICRVCARWTLAGGLTPTNVADALLASGAKSVDVASGVEYPKGVKSPPLIDQFASCVRDAVAGK